MNKILAGILSFFLWIMPWWTGLYNMRERVAFDRNARFTFQHGWLTWYRLWCWKGDYYNLGPGAEIGIYYTDDVSHKNEGHYDIDFTDLMIKVHMKITYNGLKVNQVLNDFVQTNWWVCSFSPWVADEEKIDEKNIKVALDVSYDVDPTKVGNNPNGHLGYYNNLNPGAWDKSLWAAFEAEANYQKNTLFDWPNVILNSPPSGYQFRINY